MVVEERRGTEYFWDDIRTHIGNARRKRATKGEHNAILQLCGFVFGHHGESANQDLDGILAAKVIRNNGEEIEVKYVNWGGMWVNIFPPRILPDFRVWYLRFENKELIVGLIPSNDIPEGEYPELTTIIGTRIREKLGECLIDQRRPVP